MPLSLLEASDFRTLPIKSFLSKITFFEKSSILELSANSDNILNSPIFLPSIKKALNNSSATLYSVNFALCYIQLKCEH